MRPLVALAGALAAMSLVTIQARAQPGVPIVYEAPAQKLPAMRFGLTFSAVLPSGRMVKPEGRSVVTGASALGVALSPDGRFAFVAGSTLAAVDVDSMEVVAQYAAPPLHPYTSVIAVRDPSNPSQTLVVASAAAADTVYFYRFADRELAPARSPTLTVSGFPETLVASLDGKTVYAIQSLGDTVTAIDLASRRTRSSRKVGYAPMAAAAERSHLFVCNEGLMQYGKLATPAVTPTFETPPPNMDRASSLDALALDASGKLVAAAQDADDMLHMDRPPDGIHIVGGAHPSAIALTPDGDYAYVTMANVDRIAVVSLQGTPRVVAGLDLRLFPKGPFGTQPQALALSGDGKRLYVALAGLDAVAVLDATHPLQLRRLGLVPTGDYPAALALGDDDRALYVVNARGFGPQGGTLPSTLQRIDLTNLSLVHDTYTTLDAVRVARSAPHDALVPALGTLRASNRIKHVVLILEEDKTFDSMLGDLTDARGRAHGNGDVTLTAYGATVTPNLHLLARTYAVADNFYADSRTLVLGHEFALGGTASDYSVRRSLSGGLPREDPEDYARYGYIFNTLALHRISYRDYGDLMLLRGYDGNAASDPQDRFQPTDSLGGTYSLDVPALAALRGHVDERYPGWNPNIRDERRAREFVRDYDELVEEHHAPRFSVVWLPGDRSPSKENVADGDRALGVIVSHLTRTPAWKDTAIFIMPADASTERDHVSDQRAYAVVVSPFAKRGYVGHRHLSTTSVLKTEEELLGLPPLSLGDLLATGMADFFTTQPDFAPYTARAVPTQPE